MNVQLELVGRNFYSSLIDSYPVPVVTVESRLIYNLNLQGPEKIIIRYPCHIYKVLTVDITQSASFSLKSPSHFFRPIWLYRSPTRRTVPFFYKLISDNFLLKLETNYRFSRVFCRF